MIRVIQAIVHWRNKPFRPVKIERIVHTDKELEQLREELVLRYFELGIDDVTIDFQTMQIEVKK